MCGVVWCLCRTRHPVTPSHHSPRPQGSDLTSLGAADTPGGGESIWSIWSLMSTDIPTPTTGPVFIWSSQVPCLGVSFSLCSKLYAGKWTTTFDDDTTFRLRIEIFFFISSEIKLDKNMKFIGFVRCCASQVFFYFFISIDSSVDFVTCVTLHWVTLGYEASQNIKI